MRDETEKLHLDPGDRRYELIDYDQFAASGHADGENPDSETMTASGRFVWTWETLDQAQGQTSPTEEPEEAAETATPDQTSVRTAPVHREASPEGAYRHYAKALRQMQSRGPLSLLLCLPALYGTLAAVWGWWLPGFGGMGRYILAGLLVLQMGLCYEVILGGISELLQHTFGVQSLTVTTALLTLLDALLSKGEGVPFCAVAMLGLSTAFWGNMARTAAFRRSLKLLVQAQDPASAVTVPNSWERLCCMVRQNQPLEGFVTDLEGRDLSRRALSLYAPTAAILALLLGGCASLHSQTPYLTCTAAILCGALPLGGALCFSQPFEKLSQELARTGAALGGWTGAKACTNTQGVLLRDRDLFGIGSIQQSGLKVYNDYPPAQVVSYCGTVLAESGGGLYEAVTPLLEEFHAKLHPIGEYKIYEGGGLGAEVLGNVVLVGSLPFMRLMGVILPQGAAVKQAVYVSINGELAGIIGIHYEPAASVRSALRLLQNGRGLQLILATQDFLLTPAFLKACFGLKSDRFVFPSAQDRDALAAQEEPDGTSQARAAVLATEGIRPLAKVLLGGRSLVRITSLNLICCLAGGILGLLLVSYLCFTGALYSLNAGTILVYALVWLLPVLLFSRWVTGTK